MDKWGVKTVYSYEGDVSISYDNVLNMALNKFLTKKIVSNGFEKLFTLGKIIREISSLANVKYPHVIVLPEARILEHSDGIHAIIYANISYRKFNGRLHPVVETYLPFLLYAENNVLKAVFAHELLHYIYLAIKYLREEHLVTLDIYTSNYSGRVFLDEVYQVRPELVFKDKSYVKMLNFFDKVLSKSKVANSIKRNWIEKGKPSRKYSSREFRLRISLEDWNTIFFPDTVLERVRDLIDEYVG